MIMTMTPAAFLSAAPQTSASGSSPWATRYAAEIRRIWTEAAAVDPRTLQTHLGPSELGVACDRQVVGKMAGLPVTNHVTDPWPSIRGKALHAHAVGVFAHANAAGGARFLAERKVYPMPDHPGTADLYDAREQAVVDHKFLGMSSMNKARTEPPRKYRRQLFLYALGYRDLGLPVRRTVLVAYPATAGSLDGLYVHEWPFTDGNGLLYPEVAAELKDTFEETARRHAMADELLAGRLDIMSTPAAPEPDECYFCPLYRPQATTDPGYGCPGIGPATPSI